MLRGAAARVGAALVMSAAIGALSGCVPFLPSVPNDRPLALTVRDGEVWFRWCGDPSETFSYLGIDYRIFAGESEFVTVTEGTGEFRFSATEDFSTIQAPAGIVYQRSGPIPLSTNRTLIYVFPGQSKNNLGPWRVSFDSPSLADLREGQWLHPSGRVDSQPCASD